MKKLNEKDLKIIKEALISAEESCYDNAYIESQRNNIKRAKEIEKYAEEIKRVLEKLY